MPDPKFPKITERAAESPEANWAQITPESAGRFAERVEQLKAKVDAAAAKVKKAMDLTVKIATELAKDPANQALLGLRERIIKANREADQQFQDLNYEYQTALTALTGVMPPLPEPPSVDFEHPAEEDEVGRRMRSFFEDAPTLPLVEVVPPANESYPTAELNNFIIRQEVLCIVEEKEKKVEMPEWRLLILRVKRLAERIAVLNLMPDEKNKQKLAGLEAVRILDYRSAVSTITGKHTDVSRIPEETLEEAYRLAQELLDSLGVRAMLLKEGDSASQFDFAIGVGNQVINHETIIDDSRPSGTIAKVYLEGYLMPDGSTLRSGSVDVYA